MTNSAVTARGRTRQRAAAQQTGRAERDARIAAAAAKVAAARDTIHANAERRALAVAAAHKAIDFAERGERNATAAADEQILAAVRRLRADGLTVAKIADLLHLPVPDVRRWMKRAHCTVDRADAAAASTDTASPAGTGAG